MLRGLSKKKMEKVCSKICFQTLGQFIFGWHVSIEIQN